MPKQKKAIEIDGATGEGGGQLVRIATVLAAVTLQPIRIVNIRANRPKGGLKSQHFTSIKWLADATGADVEGLEIGSRTLNFSPRLPPTALLGRRFSVKAESSAASALLILQALLPYLIFAGGVTGGSASKNKPEQAQTDNEPGPEPEPIELEISGGTNVSFSLSYEYLDQVLLPALHDRFGIVIERRLMHRGWSLGPQSRGSIWIRVHPLRPGQTLKPTVRDGEGQGSREIAAVDVTIVAPVQLHDAMKEALSQDLHSLFPGVAEPNFVTVEDSGHDSRIYVLLVARTAGRLRWGRDVLTSTPKTKGKKNPPPPVTDTAAKVSRQVCRDLRKDMATGGEVDEHLQDQLVCFQALAEGVSAVLRGGGRGAEEHEDEDAQAKELEAALEGLKIGEGVRKDRNDEPFGHGSLHTRTARWIASEILPAVQFYHKGSICDGAGVSFQEAWESPDTSNS